MPTTGQQLCSLLNSHLPISRRGLSFAADLFQTVRVGSKPFAWPSEARNFCRLVAMPSALTRRVRWKCAINTAEPHYRQPRLPFPMAPRPRKPTLTVACIFEVALQSSGDLIWEDLIWGGSGETQHEHSQTEWF